MEPLGYLDDYPENTNANPDNLEQASDPNDLANPESAPADDAQDQDQQQQPQKASPRFSQYELEFSAEPSESKDNIEKSDLKSDKLENQQDNFLNPDVGNANDSENAQKSQQEDDSERAEDAKVKETNDSQKYQKESQENPPISDKDSSDKIGKSDDQKKEDGTGIAENDLKKEEEEITYDNKKEE